VRPPAALLEQGLEVGGGAEAARGGDVEAGPEVLDGLASEGAEERAEVVAVAVGLGPEDVDLGL